MKRPFVIIIPTATSVSFSVLLKYSLFKKLFLNSHSLLKQNKHKNPPPTELYLSNKLSFYFYYFKSQPEKNAGTALQISSLIKW